MMRFSSRFLLCSIIALTVLSCSREKGQEKPKGRPPAPVSTATAVTRTVPVFIDAIGSVESLSQVSIKSMINGEITKVYFREGEDVSRGTVLFTLDSRPYEAALKKAEADLARIRAQLSTAKTNAERYGKLVKEGIVTSEQYESLRTLAESLEADMGAQQANIESLRVQLSYCTIRSPISGRTGNLMIHPGNIVKANDTASLVTINQIRPIYVAFSVPERELARIRQSLGNGKMRVEARLQGDNGPPETGEVTFLDNTVDQATATIKLKGTFANSRSRLWPGQFATVRLTLASLADAVVVPNQAVQTGQQGQYVIVVTGDTVDFRPIRTGVTVDGMTVVEQGLRAGETVVTDGHMRVVPGGKVSVKQGEASNQGTVKAGKTTASLPEAGSAKP